MRRRVRFLIIALGAAMIAALFMPAGPANAACGPATCRCGGPPANGTCTWAGWGVYGGDYTSISGNFDVPTVSGTGTVAMWYGLGVVTGLEQTGVECNPKSKPVCRAWWEVIYKGGHGSINNPHYFSQKVKPGDGIVASVSYSTTPASTGGMYWLFLHDVTAKWSEKVPVTANGPNGGTSREGAEAILEDPEVSTGVLPLPDFRIAWMNDIKVNGNFSWEKDDPIEYTLGTGKVFISPLDPVGDFSVTWKHG